MESAVFKNCVTSASVAEVTQFLNTVDTSLPQIISVSALTGCFSRSEWLHLEVEGKENPQPQPDLLRFAKRLSTIGNMDKPEAAKTGLAKAHEIMRSEAETLILCYTDAPPHTIALNHRSGNAQNEREGLNHGASSRLFTDWVPAAKTLAMGDKKAQVFALLHKDMPAGKGAYYYYLYEMTQGACIYLKNQHPGTICKASVELLLAWMSVEKPTTGDDNRTDFPGTWSYYYNRPTTNSMGNNGETAVTKDILRERLPKRPTPAQSPIQQWSTDNAYRTMATGKLLQIIDKNVSAMAVNAVFGSLWRAVCKDSDAVGKIQDQKKKDIMQAWLEESYDFSPEVQAIIDAVPEDDQFPCVLLDPTVNFASTNQVNEAALMRRELIEISRYYDANILRGLGRVLTRLTYIKDASAMPEHRAGSGAEQAWIIPLALATDRHGNEFWKVLLHTITPGTQLVPRAAAVLAALSLRMGITFLTDVAACEMLGAKNSWRDIEVPETWAMGCLRLLLQANNAYRELRSQSDNPQSLLNESDMLLFDKLLAFKTLEYNSDAPVTIEVPWTPKESTYSIGPVVTCRVCQCPRAVTVMGPNGQCGLCLRAGFDAEDFRVQVEASRAATPQSKATWLECRVPSCRAQYVQMFEPGDLPIEYRPSSFHENAFVCSGCESGRETIIETEKTARELTKYNPFSWLVEDTDNPTENPFINPSIFHLGRKIHNTKQVKAKLKQFASGIRKAAGSGCIINTAALACPFCRRFPAPRTLTKYGKGIHAVQNLKDATTNHGSWVYAWCARCSSAKEFAARDCARRMPPAVTNWQRKPTMKPCPKCGIMSERISGCGYIVCPVQGCGTHWCYFCGKDIGEGWIYRHMEEKHGAQNGYEADYDLGMEFKLE
ncbi:uncharacterized protein BDV14DRAFT_188970 [Aspergillus stella-maris]|uniref:uncharacterized protein n=1 Tax=Aspergillus stella-maris TaxID=1810926 RepID=UPI003CCC915E